MMTDYGVGALGGVVLIDPDTGLPYKASGGGGGGGAVPPAPETGTYILSSEDGVSAWITIAELMDLING